MKLYLRDDLKACFKAEKPLFDQLLSLSGECYRDQEGRKTQRVRLGGKYYFLKTHHGVGYKEIIKNILQGRLPVTGARNEWLAIQKLSSAGVTVPGIAGFGERGWNPATKESFILLDEIKSQETMDDVCRAWRDNPPALGHKQALINDVARIVRILHEQGVNHRDLYLCHFLNEQNAITLIDLHRAEIRPQVPRRWHIKDLAGIYFSGKACGLGRKDWYRFIAAYRQMRLTEVVREERVFWDSVVERGEKVYRDHAN